MTQMAPLNPKGFDFSRMIVIGGVNYTALGLALLGLFVSILVFRLFGFQYGFPEAISSRIDFIYWINIGEDWLKANVRDTTRAVAKVITGTHINGFRFFNLLKKGDK